MRRIFASFFLLFLLCGCATTKYVPQGSFLLHKNQIEVSPAHAIEAKRLNTYLRQKPNTKFIFGTRMFLGLYSLSDTSDTGWNRFLRRVGEPPVIYDSVLAQNSADNIDRALTSLGYFHNRVTTSVSQKRRKATVTYLVQPGNTYTIDSITSFFSDSLLQKIYFTHPEQSWLKRGHVLSADTLEMEQTRINDLMRNNGYYAFNKNFISFVADTLAHSGGAHLELHVNDYSRNQTPDDRVPHKLYALRSIKVYPGFDPIAAAMDTGYYAHLDSLDYEGLRVYYRQKPVVRPRVISRLNLLETGQLYNEKTVKNSYNRLSSIRLYNGITMLFDQPDSNSVSASDTLDLDCIIRLNPGNSQGYKLNLEASSNSNGLIGISPALSYYHKNIFRGGEWLTVGLMGNFQFKLKDPIRSTEMGVSMTLSLPRMLFPIRDTYFKNNVPRTDVSANYNYQSRPEYTRNMASTSFGYTWNMHDRFYYTVQPVRLKLVKLSNMSPSFLASLNDPFILDTYRDHLDLGLSAMLYYTTDASTTHTRNYFYVRTGLESSGNALSAFNKVMKSDSTGARTISGIAYSQYIKIDVNTAYTWVFGTSHQLAARFYGGLGLPYGNANSMPLEQTFYSGGANSLRGWQARTVGPGSSPVDSTFSIPNQNGDIKLEANVEYRFPLFWKMEGALFADAGNVWTRNSKGKHPNDPGVFKWNDFYNSIAVDAGLGLRMNMGFLIVRLDFGMVMRDPVARRWLPTNEWLKKDTYSFQFGVGYPF